MCAPYSGRDFFDYFYTFTLLGLFWSFRFICLSLSLSLCRSSVEQFFSACYFFSLCTTDLSATLALLCSTLLVLASRQKLISYEIIERISFRAHSHKHTHENKEHSSFRLHLLRESRDEREREKELRKNTCSFRNAIFLLLCLEMYVCT
jgi:predicted membrane metal-binding protein